MNSEIYLALARVDYKPANFKQYALKVEQAYFDLRKTIQKHQLSQPDTLEKYCRTAFFQITIEQERLEGLLKHFDKSEPLIGDYYSEQRHFLTEILDYALDSRATIIEYFSVYKPDIFKGAKAILIKELPTYNQFRQLFEEVNVNNREPGNPEIKKQQPQEQQPKLIFVSDAQRWKVYEVLEPYFYGQSKALSLALVNEKPVNPLIFSGSAKQIIEFFRRLCYNQVLLNAREDIMSWLLANVHFTNKRKSSPLKRLTIDQYFSKDKGDIGQSKRIGKGIFPYLSHDKQQALKTKD